MAIDWTPIIKKYKGKWVALESDEITVLAAANSAVEALKEARNKGYESPILTKVPTKVVSYIGNGLSL